MSKKVHSKHAKPLTGGPPSVTIGTITYTSPTMKVPGTVNPAGNTVSGMSRNLATQQTYPPDAGSVVVTGSSWKMTYTGLPKGTYSVQVYMGCPQGTASDQTQYTIS
jgi:hypothetical protein